MPWFLVVMLAALCWSIAVHTDKFVLSRYFKASGPGGYMLFSTLVQLCAVAAIIATHPTFFNVPRAHIAGLAISGITYIIAMLIYLWAMTKEEATRVSIIFQTIPVFSFVLEYFFLHTIFSRNQIIGGIIILCGALLISIDSAHSSAKKIHIKYSVLGAMLGASILLAIQWIVFKQSAIAGEYWLSVGWQYMGCLFAGACLFIFVRPFRKDFFHVFKANGPAVLALNVANDIINESGNRLMSYAVMFTPVTLAQLANGFQAVFVFLIGISLTKFFPSISKESMTKKDLIQKITAISIMLFGAWVLGW